MELVLSFVIVCAAVCLIASWGWHEMFKWRQKREQERMLVREIERFLQSKYQA